MKGTIRRWNDDKGYGFITPQGGGDNLFFHVSALKDRHRRPGEGEAVSFRPGKGRNGKPCAIAIDFLDDSNWSGLVGSAFFLPGVIFLLLIVTVTWAGLDPLVIALYMLMSLLTYAMYAADKSAARRNAWRVSENSLHLLSLAGGWPGALVAQKRLRHKTVKQPFKFLFWLTVTLNVAGFLWLLTPEGSTILNGIVNSLI